MRQHLFLAIHLESLSSYMRIHLKYLNCFTLSIFYPLMVNSTHFSSHCFSAALLLTLLIWNFLQVSDLQCISKFSVYIPHKAHFYQVLPSTFSVIKVCLYVKWRSISKESQAPPLQPSTGHDIYFISPFILTDVPSASISPTVGHLKTDSFAQWTISRCLLINFLVMSTPHVLQVTISSLN